MPIKALVTGGGGFLGRYIVEQLRDRGDQVRILARGAYPELNDLGVETHRGDLQDQRAVSKACVGIDVVFHTAAIPGVWGPWQHYYNTNVIGTRNVLAACNEHGVKRLIFTSSPSVVFDGKPHVDADESMPYPDKYLCHYPHTKAIAEREVLAANGQNGLLTIALRPHLIWGPRDNHLIPRLLQRAASGRLKQVGDGSNIISMSYVENSAAAHLQAEAALTENSPAAGNAYFINEPEPVNLWNWVNEILKRAGMQPIKKSISASTAYRIGAVLEAVYSTFRLRSEPPMTRFVALQLSQSHSYSVQKAQRDFGYTPIVPYEEAMRRLQEKLPVAQTTSH